MRRWDRQTLETKFSHFPVVAMRMWTDVCLAALGSVGVLELVTFESDFRFYKTLVLDLMLLQDAQVLDLLLAQRMGESQWNLSEPEGWLQKCLCLRSLQIY